MIIDLVVSEKMRAVNRHHKAREEKFIRLPEAGRAKYGLQIGQFLNLRCKDGTLLPLQVMPAFAEDAAVSGESGHVTQGLFDRLDLVENRQARKIEIVQNITLGCDPEFFLLDATTNKLIPSSWIFEKKQGQLGHDGMMVEIRPYPSVYPDVLTKNIGDLIIGARNLIDRVAPTKGYAPNNVRMIAASCVSSGNIGFGAYTAGFHLHYGLPIELLGNTSYDHPRKRAIRQIVKVLDYYVGLISILPEGNSESMRRCTPYLEYGKPGGFRLDNRTMEYRVPGGVMLKHPALTRGLIALGALVVEDIISRMNLSTDKFSRLDTVSSEQMDELYPNVPRTYQEIFGLICNPDTKPALMRLESIADDLSMMVGFDKNREAVEVLLNMIQTDNRFDWDIENNWRGFNAEQQRQVEVHTQRFQAAHQRQ